MVTLRFDPWKPLVWLFDNIVRRSELMALLTEIPAELKDLNDELNAKLDTITATLNTTRTEVAALGVLIANLHAGQIPQDQIDAIQTQYEAVKTSLDTKVEAVSAAATGLESDVEAIK